MKIIICFCGTVSLKSCINIFIIIFFIGLSTFYSTILVGRGQSDGAVHGYAGLPLVIGGLTSSVNCSKAGQPYCGHRNPSANISEVFHLQPSLSSSLPSSLDYRREPILPAICKYFKNGLWLPVVLHPMEIFQRIFSFDLFTGFYLMCLNNSFLYLLSKCWTLFCQNRKFSYEP